MDWKYKHFNQEAIFTASRENIREAARAVITESLDKIEDTDDGFVASGYSAWHAAIATVRITSGADGTKMAVELLVERAALRGYMLFDIGSYYNGQIDKWFSGISQRIEGNQESNSCQKIHIQPQNTARMSFRMSSISPCRSVSGNICCHIRPFPLPAVF